MKLDYSKTINEQLEVFDYYKNNYLSYQLEIERLNKENNDLINNNNYWKRKCSELNNIIKEVRNQLTYLETYSNKEDVFDDMKRRLDRIDKIIGSDKE